MESLVEQHERINQLDWLHSFGWPGRLHNPGGPYRMLMRLIVSQPHTPPIWPEGSPRSITAEQKPFLQPEGGSRYGDVLRQWPHVRGSLGVISGQELRHEEEEEKDVETAGDEFPAAGHRKPERILFVCHSSPLTCSLLVALILQVPFKHRLWWSGAPIHLQILLTLGSK